MPKKRKQFGDYYYDDDDFDDEIEDDDEDEDDDFDDDDDEIDDIYDAPDVSDYEDYAAEDDPSDGFDLGDPQETMLAFALGLMEGRTPPASGTRSSEAAVSQDAALEVPFHKPGFGVLVGTGKGPFSGN